MKRYSTDYIVSEGRNPRFWQPSSFWGWLWRLIVFLILLVLFILLFCRECTQSGADTPILHEGDVEITLEWETSDDLDLHCIGPRRDEIYFDNRRGRSGGYLDSDMNVRGGVNGVKVKTVGNTVPIDTVIQRTIVNNRERVNVIDFNVSY